MQAEGVDPEGSWLDRVADGYMAGWRGGEAGLVRELGFGGVRGGKDGGRTDAFVKPIFCEDPECTGELFF